MAVEEAGFRMGDVPAAAGLDQRVQRRQPRLVVVAQAARVVVPDALQRAGSPRLAHLEHLVDLLLVFDDGHAHFGVVHREDVFGGHRVLVQRHRHGAQRLHGQHRRIQARPVLADDHDVVVALQTGLGQAAGHGAHLGGEVGPGRRLPDAVHLFAQRGRAGALGGVLQASGAGRWSAPGFPLRSCARGAACGRHRCLGRASRRGSIPIVGPALTPCCRCDDNPRVPTDRHFPMTRDKLPVSQRMQVRCCRRVRAPWPRRTLRHPVARPARRRRARARGRRHACGAGRARRAGVSGRPAGDLLVRRASTAC
jgi:hypothetical protein